MQQPEENDMNKIPLRSPLEPATAPWGLLNRWVLAHRKQPSPQSDLPEVDLGYESALPWFTQADMDTADEARSTR